MLTIYPQKLARELPLNSPLHVSHFFNLVGMRWRARKQRQALILAVAQAWQRLADQQVAAPGFVQEELFLTHLAKHSPSAKFILERFFKIERTGFKYPNGQCSPTRVSPLKLPPSYRAAIEKVTAELTFHPGDPPVATTLIKSQVIIRPVLATPLLERLVNTGHSNLVLPVKWLLARGGTITFYFRQSGRLLARDTSVWPIRAIETWPGWLRAELFGTTVDIDSAFTQFLVENLLKKHAGNRELLQLKYPDLLLSLENKRAFRLKLIQELLGTEPTPKAIKLIKHLLMAVANGSNASPKLFTADHTRCEAANIIRAGAPELSLLELEAAGRRLQRLARQFKQAKKELCFYLLNERPSIKNQKLIFARYFDWERQARHRLWKAVGQTGLHLHDGLDGIITASSPTELEQHLEFQTGLKVTVVGTPTPVKSC